MRQLLRTSFTITLILLTVSIARATTIVPWSARNTVDSDGDLTPDLMDNAPGVSNNQQDADADGIGDIIDPTPINSNPFLGDPGLALGAPSTISAGSQAQIPYLVVLATPPGAFGHIDLDLGADGIYDATYFGPLTSSLNNIDIAPSLFVDALWDLNTPGTYVLHAKAFGPGMSSQFVSITNVNVVPECASFILIATGAAGIVLVRRRNPQF